MCPVEMLKKPKVILELHSIVVYKKRLAIAAGKLLLGDLNKLFRNVAPKRACIARRNVAVVAVSRNLYAKLLRSFHLHLVKSLSCLRNNKLVASACHKVFLLSSSSL